MFLFAEEPEVDSDTEAPVKNQFVKAPTKQIIEDKDESSDSDDWPSDSESSSESSDDDEGKYTSMREKFLKKPGTIHEDDEEKEERERRKEERRKERKEKERRKKQKDEEEDGEGEWETVQRGVAIPSVRKKNFINCLQI